MTLLFVFITFAMTDLTKGQRDEERGQKRDTEDSGQLEERVVDIYESVNLFGLVPRPLRDPAGRDTQGKFDNIINL